MTTLSKEHITIINDGLRSAMQGKEPGCCDFIAVLKDNPDTWIGSGEDEPDEPHYEVYFTVTDDSKGTVIDQIILIED